MEGDFHHPGKGKDNENFIFIFVSPGGPGCESWLGRNQGLSGRNWWYGQVCNCIEYVTKDNMYLFNTYYKTMITTHALKYFPITLREFKKLDYIQTIL